MSVLGLTATPSVTTARLGLPSVASSCAGRPVARCRTCINGLLAVACPLSVRGARVSASELYSRVQRLVAEAPRRAGRQALEASPLIKHSFTQHTVRRRVCAANTKNLY